MDEIGQDRDESLWHAAELMRAHAAAKAAHEKEKHDDPAVTGYRAMWAAFLAVHAPGYKRLIVHPDRVMARPWGSPTNQRPGPPIIWLKQPWSVVHSDPSAPPTKRIDLPSRRRNQQEEPRELASVS